MFLSAFTEEDGVHEALASFDHPANKHGGDAGPILRVRAVKNSEGSFRSVIRAFHGRGVLLSEDHHDYDLEKAKVRAVELLGLYLQGKSALDAFTITRRDGIARTFVPGVKSIDEM